MLSSQDGGGAMNNNLDGTVACPRALSLSSQGEKHLMHARSGSLVEGPMQPIRSGTNQK